MDTTFHKLFIDELRDAYHAEKQLVKALPRMSKAATSMELKGALDAHLTETEEHVSRIEKAFELLDETPRTKVCAGMQGIVEEGSDVIKEEEKGPALDAAIVASGQRAEHYEIAAYGTLIAWAKAMGHDDVADLLHETLEEEKAADEKLTELADGGINLEAAGNDDDAEPEIEDGAGEEAPAVSRGKGQARGGSAAANGRMAAMKTASRRR